jgi:aspartate carbamoyltransferase catalytic subunit
MNRTQEIKIYRDSSILFSEKLQSPRHWRVQLAPGRECLRLSSPHQQALAKESVRVTHPLPIPPNQPHLATVLNPLYSFPTRSNGQDRRVACARPGW